MEPLLGKPSPITSVDDVTGFDCGDQSLNDYLRKHALTNHRNESARTYVATRGTRVVGYYTLAAGAVSPEGAPARVKKGLARHPIPIILLARLAADRMEQGKGIGKGLLKDALLRVAQAADIIGCRALLVHAKDETAKTFYLKYGFEPSPVDDMHLCLLMKDLRKAISS